MATERELIDQVQRTVKAKYQGRYAALVKRLGGPEAGWYKQKVSRVLNSKNPGTVEFLAVAYAAGIALGPLLQHTLT